MSMFMRPISVEMRKPMPTIGVPKNSATMAPISARVELILRELKIEGSALRSRTLPSVCQYSDPSDRMSPQPMAAVACQPGAVFASLGQKKLVQHNATLVGHA